MAVFALKGRAFLGNFEQKYSFWGPVRSSVKNVCFFFPPVFLFLSLCVHFARFCESFSFKVVAVAFTSSEATATSNNIEDRSLSFFFIIILGNLW